MSALLPVYQLQRLLSFPNPDITAKVGMNKYIRMMSSSKEVTLMVMNGKATWENLSTAGICFLHECSHTNTLEAVVSTSVSHLIYHLVKKGPKGNVIIIGMRGSNNP